MSFSAANIPLLSGWVLVSEAAEMLGLSKQAVHGKLRNNEFSSAHRIGDNVTKPIYVIDRTEIEALIAKRAAVLTTKGDRSR